MQNINYQIKISSSNVTGSALPKNAINAGNFSLLLDGIQRAVFTYCESRAALTQLWLQMWLERTGMGISRWCWGSSPKNGGFGSPR